MRREKLINTFNKCCRYPLGQKLFSWYAASKAPYFSTVKPVIKTLKKNQCDIYLKKRKKLHNHIGTFHIIAIANGLEMAMGFMAEASIPKHLRWIPKGMTLDYVSKGTTDMLCSAKVKADDWQAGDILVPVTAVDTKGEVIVSGNIKLWITEDPKYTK